MSSSRFLSPFSSEFNVFEVRTDPPGSSVAFSFDCSTSVRREGIGVSHSFPESLACLEDVPEHSNSTEEDSEGFVEDPLPSPSPLPLVPPDLVAFPCEMSPSSPSSPCAPEGETLSASNERFDGFDRASPHDRQASESFDRFLRSMVRCHDDPRSHPDEDTEDREDMTNLNNVLGIATVLPPPPFVSGRCEPQVLFSELGSVPSESEEFGWTTLRGSSSLPSSRSSSRPHSPLPSPRPILSSTTLCDPNTTFASATCSQVLLVRCPFTSTTIDDKALEEALDEPPEPGGTRVVEKAVELGKFDPPLWHAPYGRIV